MSRSRARFSDDRVAARDASWPQSAGAGVERSGRSRSNPTSRSSGQLRSWSASERCPLPVDGARGGRGGHRPHASGLLQRPGPVASTMTDPGRAASAGGSDQVELHYGAATDVGLVREVNEDSSSPIRRSSWSPTAWAATTAATSPAGSWSRSSPGSPTIGYDPRRGSEAVMATLRPCQRRLSEYGATHRGSDGGRWHGGTTAVVALLVEEDDGGPQWLLANLGDSRIYRFSRGELYRVSTDHSVVQELVDSGRITEEQALVHPERHIVTRALGGPDPLDPDFFVRPAGRRRAGPAVLRRRHRPDPRRRDRRGAPGERRPARRRRAAWSPALWPRAASTTPPRSSSMWWDWPTIAPTTPTPARESAREAGSPAVTVTRTVVPGDWYGVLGRRASSSCCRRPPRPGSPGSGRPSTRAPASTRCSTPLISGGLRELPGFVLVSGDGRDVKVVIRGAGEAELTTTDGPVTVSGSADTTWVEQNVARRDRPARPRRRRRRARRTRWGRGWCGSRAWSIPRAPAP